MRPSMSSYCCVSSAFGPTVGLLAVPATKKYTTARMMNATMIAARTLKLFLSFAFFSSGGKMPSACSSVSSAGVSFASSAGVSSTGVSSAGVSGVSSAGSTGTVPRMLRIRHHRMMRIQQKRQNLQNHQIQINREINHRKPATTATWLLHTGCCSYQDALA